MIQGFFLLLLLLGGVFGFGFFSLLIVLSQIVISQFFIPSALVCMDSQPRKPSICWLIPCLFSPCGIWLFTHKSLFLSFLVIRVPPVPLVPLPFQWLSGSTMPRTEYVLPAGFMPELFKVTALFLPSPPFCVTWHIIYRQSRLALSWFSGRLNCELPSSLFSLLVVVPLTLIALQVARLSKVCVWEFFPSLTDFLIVFFSCWILPLTVGKANISMICLYFSVPCNLMMFQSWF